MNPQERANKVHQWKVLVCHKDLGAAAVIEKELRNNPLVPDAPKDTTPVPSEEKKVLDKS
jgi:hypothetical protein